MSAWVTHIKEFAREKGISYGCALSDPNCSITYQAKKLAAMRPVTEQRPRANTLLTEETIKERARKTKKGRTPKYATEEERKKAKRDQTLASNKRKNAEKQYNKKMENDLKL